MSFMEPSKEGNSVSKGETKKQRGGKEREYEMRLIGSF